MREDSRLESSTVIFGLLREVPRPHHKFKDVSACEQPHTYITLLKPTSQPAISGHITTIIHMLYVRPVFDNSYKLK